MAVFFDVSSSNSSVSKKKPVVEENVKAEAVAVKEQEIPDKTGETVANPGSNEGKTKELEGRLAEVTEVCQRVQAEFENYQKRVQKEKGWIKEQEKTRVLTGFLPIWESFEKAVQHQKPGEKEGLEAIFRQFNRFLESEGVRPMESAGKMFDPNIHDCVLQETVKGFADGVVVEEIQKGFFLNQQVLRHAKVKINKINEQDVKK